MFRLDRGRSAKIDANPMHKDFGRGLSEIRPRRGLRHALITWAAKRSISSA